MAMAVEEQTTRDYAFIPINLRIGQFTQFAFDNLEFQEYTKDGRTLHGITNVIFKSKNPDEDLTPMVSLPLLKICQTALESSQPFQTKESHL